MLHFWASWCSTCRYELPSLEHLNRKLSDKGLVIISILEDEVLTPSDIERLNSMSSLTFPVLLDKENRVADEYMSYGVPESFIIDRDGVILERISGAVDWISPPRLAYFNRLLDNK